jgi:antitoxin (DNA-binding transcriptional repressor) of toxin-antitoxin stability system
MISVTAKNLRDNLSEYLDRLQKGEEIVIIRHSEIVGTLKPADNKIMGNGSAIGAMLQRNKATFIHNKGLTNESLSTKELYHKALNEDYSK